MTTNDRFLDEAAEVRSYINQTLPARFVYEVPLLVAVQNLEKYHLANLGELKAFLQKDISIEMLKESGLVDGDDIKAIK